MSEMTLGSIISARPEYGANFPAIPANGNDPRFLRITDVDNGGRLLHEDVKAIPRLFAEPYLLEKNDLVVARTGNTVGKSYLYRPSDGELAFAGYLIRFRLDPLKCDPDFVFQFFHSPNYDAWIDRSIRTGAQPNINAKEYEALLIPAFEVSTQRRIAAVLRTVDEVIEATEARIEKQQAIKQGLLHDLFTRGVTPDGLLRPPPTERPDLYQESELGLIPKEWKVDLLDNCAERGSGHTPNRLRPEFWNGGIKWVSLADSWRLDQLFISETDKEISALGLANSSAVLHPPGIVILSRDAGVGKSAITTSPMAVSQHFMCWRCGPKLDNYFLYYLLQQRKREFENIATGTTIPTIGLSYFRKYKIALPKELSEQSTIGQILVTHDEQRFDQEKTLTKLHQLKSALMQDLLTGRVSAEAIDLDDLLPE